MCKDNNIYHCLSINTEQIHLMREMLYDDSVIAHPITAYLACVN